MTDRLADAQEAVRRFHSEFGSTISNVPQLVDVPLRLRLIREEVNELSQAVRNANSLVEAADALADLTYVVLGSAVAWGIPLGKVFEVVHEANMRKTGGKTRPDGKILKPEGWVGPEPEIERILKEAHDRYTQS